MLNGEMDQLTTVNSVPWYGHELRMEHSDVFGRTLSRKRPHQGNMSRSWLRDTDSQNGDALLCIYYINFMYSE